MNVFPPPPASPKSQDLGVDAVPGPPSSCSISMPPPNFDTTPKNPPPSPFLSVGRMCPRSNWLRLAPPPTTCFPETRLAFSFPLPKVRRRTHRPPPETPTALDPPVFFARTTIPFEGPWAPIGKKLGYPNFRRHLVIGTSSIREPY